MSSRGRRFRLAAITFGVVSVITSAIQTQFAIHASADTAQRTSWNATSTQAYKLWSNNGSQWIEMDPSRLALSITPAVTSDAVLSANGDLFTSASSVNTDLAIEVNGTVEVWKEAGGYSAFRPAAVFAQAEMTMTAGTTYSVALYWKTNVVQPAGVYSQAGAGAAAPFSPTVLSAELTPDSLGYVAASTPTDLQYSTNSGAWGLMDLNGGTQTSITTGSTGTYDALVTANVDTFTTTAGVNQDVGICSAVSSQFSNQCATSGTPGIVNYQENGGAATYKPIASLVQAHLTLSASTTYEFGIVWKANGSGTIYAGAGTSPTFSPSTIAVQITPTADPEVAATTQATQETRSFSSGDPGTTWETIPNVASLTLQETSNELVYLAGNATLFANAGGYNIDLGICVTTGSETCDGGGTYIAGWKESGSATAFSPDASFLQYPYYMLASTQYTVTLQWRTSSAMASGDFIAAGLGVTPNVTSLSSLALPSSTPSVPQGVSATAGLGQATLSWSAPASSPGSPLSGYAITPYLGSTALETERVGLVTSFTVPNLANGQTYTFSVAAINGYGSGTAATTSSVTPGLPGTPSNVVPVSAGNGTVNVSWSAASSAGASAITGYRVSSGTKTTLSWGTGTSTSVAGLTNGRRYYFTVSAMNVFGTGPSATSSSSATPNAVAPGAPTGVVATAGSASATVSWTAPASNGGDAITSYTITPYVGSTAQPTTTASSSPATVSALTNGTTYTFTVKAVNAVGTGAESTASLAVIPQTTPVIPGLALTLDKGSNATYAIGTPVTYTATLTVNTGAQETVSYQDVLPSGVSGSGASIAVNGTACAAPVTCSATSSTISVSGLTIPASGQVTVSYQVTVTGTLRSCAGEADSASVTIASGNSAVTSAPMTACDSDLGLNAWNSYVTQTLGDGGTAQVNPANGNLVVTQTDAIPMATASAATFHLQRTYNSDDTNLAGVSEPLGAGWIVSFVDVGSQPGGVGLIVPASDALTNEVPVTLVDSTGGRSVFTPSAITPINVANIASQPSVLGALLPNVLHLKDPTYTTLCVDEVLTPPAGVHESMWRYIETTGPGCVLGGSVTGLVLGYATEGVDRVRREFNDGGQLLDVQDAAGNRFGYAYAGGALSSVTESATGRAFTLSGSGPVTVTDPGGETTTYALTGGTLTQVTNPDGTTLSYNYGGCTGAAANQLCSATDARGHGTTFTYAAAAAGPPVLASFSDRNGNTTSLIYNAGNVTSDRSSSLSWHAVSERTNYASIDASGRVGEIDQGTTANAWLHQTFYGWDTATSGCRQPDGGVDNDLCSIIRRGLTSGAADRVTYYGYGDEGQMLTQRELDAGDLWTTAGYQEQYFEAGATIATYTDTVAGSGVVNSTTQNGGRRDGNTLFVVITQTQSLSPRGNAAGSGYGTYLTTYLVDNAAISPGWTNGTVCSQPSSPSFNTGLVCEDEAPTFDGTHATDTSFTYTSTGQRATVITPNNSTYTFAYYDARLTDLSGTTSVQGWLAAIIDPTGNFTAYVYDAEGHTARTWDRVATAADGVAHPGPYTDSLEWTHLADSGAVPHFSENLYTVGSDASASTFASPGRYVVAAMTAMNQWTTNTYDGNGNPIGSRTANGTGGSSTSTPVCPQPTATQTYDTCRTYDNNDNLLSLLTPMEAKTSNYGSQMPTTYSYDAFDNQVNTSNADGKLTYTYYDAVNRVTESRWSRGASGQVAVPSGCSVNPSGPSFYAGAVVCFTQTAYDGTDNIVATTDANGNTTQTLDDAAHRAIETIAPRNDGTFSTLETVTLYDADGNVTDVCPPREMSEGAADGYACTSTATFGTHTTYNALDQKATTYTYQTAGHPLTTTYGYDGDGSQVSGTDANGFTTSYGFNNLDEKTSMTVPRDASDSFTTTYGYDASGDQVSQAAPVDGTNTIKSEWTYDYDHRVVYAITGASSLPPDNSLYNATNGTDVRTQTVYDADGNVTTQYQPNAFSGSGTLTHPLSLYSVVASYNADDEQTAVYQPRYDTSSLADPVGSSTQSSQCPTQTYAGQGFLATTGVCVTTYKYDPVGNVSKVGWPTDPSGNTATVNTYTDDNLLLLAQSPNPTGGSQLATETYQYDAEGKQVSATDPNGIATAAVYTADELPASTTATPNALTTHVTGYSYDANGEQVAVTDAVGNQSTTAYLPNGWKLSATDGAGDKTSYVYDSVGNPVQVVSPSANAGDATNGSGIPTYNSYTEDNLLASTSLPVGNANGQGVLQRAVCYYYDQSGRKTAQGNWVNISGNYQSTNPCSSAVPANSFAYSYQPDGKLASETGRNGSTQLLYSYDANGNQVSSTDQTSGGVTTPNTYYADNLLRTAGDGVGRTTNYAYDGAGQVTARESVGATAYTDTIAYNAADLENSETSTAAPGTTTWSYNAGGRLATETNGKGDTLVDAYAADGTLSSETLWSGAPNSSTAESSFTQTLDGDYRVIADGCVCLNSSGSNVGRSFTYAYDQAGRLVFIGASSGASAFQTYDHDGNRLLHVDTTTGAVTTYTYNEDDSLATTTKNGVTTDSTYDSNGAGTLVSDACANWTLDTFDRTSQFGPVSGTPPTSCSSPPTTTTTYTHDASGDQVTQAANGFTTTIHNDAATGTPIVESSTNGTVTSTTVYERDAAGTPEALAFTQTGSATANEYLVDDPKGDMATSMSGTNTVQCQMQYDPYGTAVFPASSSNLCETGSTQDDLLYQNNRRDSSSGDYQLGSRTYDPSKNSFLQPDHFQTGTPAQDLAVGTDPLTRNLYTFVNGDPVNFFDPTGHSYTTGNDQNDGQGSQGCAICHQAPTRHAVGGTCNASCARSSREGRARALASDEASRRTRVKMCGQVSCVYYEQELQEKAQYQQYLAELAAQRRGFGAAADYQAAISLDSVSIELHFAGDNVPLLGIVPPDPWYVVIKLASGGGRIFSIPGDWNPRVTDNGRGWLFQDPNSKAEVRIMRPTWRYPDGYVKIRAPGGNFYTEDLEGAAGRGDSHFDLDPSGNLVPDPNAPAGSEVQILPEG